MPFSPIPRSQEALGQASWQGAPMILPIPREAGIHIEKRQVETLENWPKEDDGMSGRQRSRIHLKDIPLSVGPP